MEYVLNILDFAPLKTPVNLLKASSTESRLLRASLPMIKSLQFDEYCLTESRSTFYLQIEKEKSVENVTLKSVRFEEFDQIDDYLPLNNKDKSSELGMSFNLALYFLQG